MLNLSQGGVVLRNKGSTSNTSRNRVYSSLTYITLKPVSQVNPSPDERMALMSLLTLMAYLRDESFSAIFISTKLLYELVEIETGFVSSILSHTSRALSYLLSFTSETISLVPLSW